MQIKQAYQYCRNVAQKHYENFPVASLLIPAQYRNAIFAIYAFARRADDFADEIQDVSLARDKLDQWRQHLEQTGKGNPPDIPEFIALADVLTHTPVTANYLNDLLDAFMQDTEVRQYKDWDALLSYCQKSANPVGRMLLQLFDRHNPELLSKSDAICTGLQLINFWQDLSIDIPRKRLYIPLEELPPGPDFFEEEIRKLDEAGKNRIMASLLKKTSDIFEAGQNLHQYLPGRMGMEIKLTYLGGKAVLKKIKECGGAVFTNRPHISIKDKFRIFWSAMGS